MSKTPKSIKERLASAKLAERSLQVCLRGDLVAEFDDLERQLVQTRNAPEGAPSRGGSSPAAAIVERQNEIRAEMAEEMLTLKVRALPRAEWAERLRSHPPREDNEADRAMGVNLEPFMAEVIPLCVADPELDAEDWETLNRVLSSGDYDRLFNAVWDVNRSGVDIPKSRLASLVMAESAAGSR